MFLEILFFSLIPHITTICYLISTLKSLFFKVPEFTNKKLEEDVKKNFEDIICKTSISNNIQFRIIRHSQFCSARGINLFNPCIFIPPILDKIDKNILSFIIKHELAHIKNNDCFFIPFSGLITNITLRYLVSLISYGSVILNFLPQILSFIVIILVSRRQEKKADEYAIKNSNIEELEAAIIFFKAILSINRNFHLIDLLHPSLSERISTVEKNLNKTCVKIDNIKKIIKINYIRNLIIETFY